MFQISKIRIIFCQAFIISAKLKKNKINFVHASFRTFSSFIVYYFDYIYHFVIYISSKFVKSAIKINVSLPFCTHDLSNSKFQIRKIRKIRIIFPLPSPPRSFRNFREIKKKKRKKKSQRVDQTRLSNGWRASQSLPSYPLKRVSRNVWRKKEEREGEKYSRRLLKEVSFTCTYKAAARRWNGRRHPLLPPPPCIYRRHSYPRFSLPVDRTEARRKRERERGDHEVESREPIPSPGWFLDRVSGSLFRALLLLPCARPRLSPRDPFTRVAYASPVSHRFPGNRPGSINA